jgi:5'-nucleotidase
MEERFSPYGKRYFWIGGKVKELQQDKDSDIVCVEEGYISITPVNIDMTHLVKVTHLKDIKLF